MNTTVNKTKGFTIIEVVLVLAIAGLIFLMVFIALPALQRNQRDTARKNDVNTVASAVTSYVSNNRGEFPDTAGLQSYVDELSNNTVRVMVGADGHTVDLSSAEGTADETSTEAIQDGLIVVKRMTRCGTSTESQTFEAGTNREFTVSTEIEAGGGTAFCQNS